MLYCLNVYVCIYALIYFTPVRYSWEVSNLKLLQIVLFAYSTLPLLVIICICFCCLYCRIQIAGHSICICSIVVHTAKYFPKVVERACPLNQLFLLEYNCFTVLR